MRKRGENLKLSFKKKMEKVKFSFKELWKSFTQNEAGNNEEEVDIKEILENDNTISEQDKKILLNSMKNAEKLEQHLFKSSLAVETKKTINKWKGKNNNIPENTLSDEAKKEIAEEASKKVNQEMEQER